MTKLEFKTEIKASKEKVWFALWNDFQYRNWTSVFSEGSYAVSDWKEGSKIHFLTPTGRGMYSKISKRVENDKMFFTHIGELNNFEEQPLDEKSKSWSGATENYTLVEKNGVTTLTATLAIVEEHKDFFKEVFPKALAKVKQSAEDPWIIVETKINAPIETVWKKFTTSSDIMNWNFAHESWHCPAATNDLKTGGKFVFTMAAKDGSVSFDFGGIYNEVETNKLLSYDLGDSRKVKVEFSTKGNATVIRETFQPENANSLDLQFGGWQAILNNFKKYVELE